MSTEINDAWNLEAVMQMPHTVLHTLYLPERLNHPEIAFFLAYHF